MELEALIFDVDGTLADNERDGHLAAFNAAFAAHGLDWHWSDPLYHELLAVTGGKERIRFYLERHRPAELRRADLDRFVAELHADKTRRYAELLAQGGIPLRPGVRRLVEEARAGGLRLAIATTTSPANVTALLTHSLDPDAESWFEVIAAGDVVPAKKPAPDIYRYALERLGLGPERCLVLEDSDNGIRSALDAGLRSVVITVNDYTRDHDFSAATLVVDGFGEPDAPVEVLHGELPAGVDIVTVDALKLLHRRVWG